FGAAVGDSARGGAIALRARAGLLSDVLLPYDAHYGEVKDQSAIRTLTSRARANFARWIHDSSGISPGRRAAAAAAYDGMMQIAERAHDDLLAHGKASRLVWLPLQFALTVDQYDQENEVDSLIEQAVGRPFTDRNALTYLRSSDLPLEIARSIFAARD